jgi:hypothetical protein
MLVRVGRGNRLNVVEQAVLGPRGSREIRLNLPALTSLHGTVAALNPRVRRLRVSVNGTPVTATRTADGRGWTVPALAERARTVQLSYQLTGAIALSHRTPGRAFAVPLSLLGQALHEQGLPLVVRAEGAEVSGATCPSAPPALARCGTQLANGWSATVPAEASSGIVLLRLNFNAA